MNDESLKAMDEIMASIRKAVTVGDAPAPGAAPPPSWPPVADGDGKDGDDLEDGAEGEPEAAPVDALRHDDHDVEPAESAPVLQSTTPATPSGSGQSLEDFVRAALEPALKTWLDAHLPEIVDARVQAEIGRLTKS